MSLLDNLQAALEEAVAPRFDWVHPSWRDVVIEHLMDHPGDRRRFLSRCGVDGLALALSVSGGRAGERRLPLLQRSDDWTAVRLRAVQLVPAIDDLERRRLLAALRGLSEAVPAGPLRAEKTRMQREVLETLVAAWNAQAAPIAQGSLEVFYLVSLEVRPLVAGPHLDSTWDALADQLIADDDFDAGDADRALEFLALVQRNEPRFLRQIDWPSQFHDSVAAIEQALSEFASDAEQSLEALEKGDRENSADPEELSGEAYRFSRMGDFLVTLEVKGAAGLATRIKMAETRVDSWLERRAEEAAEKEEEMVGEAEEDAEPAAFDIDALFQDL